MAKESSSASGGIGLLGGVFLVFLILKLAEIGAVAKLSWWWVTSPLWIPALIAFCVVVLFGIVYLLLKLYNSTINKKKYEEFKQAVREREERPLSGWAKKLAEMQAKSEKG